MKPPGALVRGLAIFLSGCGVVLLAGGALTWYNQTFPERENTHLRPFPSPDGKLHAVVFRRTSPGEREFTTHVAVIRAGAKLPNRSGKAFIADGEPAIDVRWRDPLHLVITEPPGTKVILRASQIENVKITAH